MQVFIRCSQTGKKIPLEVGTSDVNKVKSKVHKMLGVPSDRLFIAGNQLDDGRTLSNVTKKKNSVDRRRVSWNNSRRIADDSDESDLEMYVDSASEKTAPSSGTSTSSMQFGTVNSKRATQSETPAPKKPTPNSVRESKSKSRRAKSTPRSKKDGKKATASPEVVVLSDDAPELFHVERVLDMRTVRGKREFLVHWKGYREDEATWEPENNLGLAKKLVAEYLKKADNKRNSLKATPKSRNTVKRRKVSQNNSRRSEDDSDESDLDLYVDSASQKTAPSSVSSKCNTSIRKKATQNETPAPVTPNSEMSVAPHRSTPTSVRFERILDMKTVRGKRKFLVHWKGYREDEATWEYEENLGPAKKLIAAYLEKEKQRAEEKQKREAENKLKSQKAKATSKSGNAVNPRKISWYYSRRIEDDSSDESDSEMYVAPVKSTTTQVRVATAPSGKQLDDGHTLSDNKKKKKDNKMTSAVSFAPEEVVVLSDDAPELFYVERILDMRLVRDKREFLVHWKGYREDEATWESEENLGLAKKLVADYLKKEKQKRAENKLKSQKANTSSKSGNAVDRSKVVRNNSRRIADDSDGSDSDFFLDSASQKTTRSSGCSTSSTQFGTVNSKCKSATQNESPAPAKLTPTSIRESKSKSQNTNPTPKSGNSGDYSKVSLNNSRCIADDSDESDWDLFVDSASQKTTPSSVSSTQFGTANAKCKTPIGKNATQNETPAPVKLTSTSVRESKSKSQKATPKSGMSGDCSKVSLNTCIADDSDESDLDMSVDSASEKTAPSSGSSASSNEEESDDNLGLASKIITDYLKKAKSKSKSQKAKATSKSKKGGKKSPAVSSTPKEVAPEEEMSDDARELYERIFGEPNSQKTKATSKSKKGSKRTSAVSSTSVEVEKRSDHGPKLYEVERILDMRLVRDKREFLVHWKGYREKEATWEPEKNLGHAKELVSAYIIEIENRPKWLRPTAVKTPNPALSQKSTLSSILRAKELEERFSQKTTPSSGSSVSSTQFGTVNSKCKTPIGKRPTQDENSDPVTPTQNRIRFSSPLSVTSPTAYIKFKKIGTQSPTSPSPSRVHHRKVAVHSQVHPSYEDMVSTILTEVGERKALNESDIYKFMVMKFKLGNDYAQIKTDLKQALKRLMIFGQIREIKGYGKWSTYQILEKKSECPPTTSTKLNNPIIHSIRSLSQSILSTGSLPTPTLIRPNTSTPLWDRTALRNMSLNGPLSSSLNASPIWGTPMPYHKSSNLGNRRQYDNDEVDEGIRKAAQLRKMKDTMHYLRV